MKSAGWIYFEIGSRIAAVRARLGVSQETLGRHVGLSRTSITNIEAGRQRPPVHVLWDIGNAMGVDPRRLLPR